MGRGNMGTRTGRALFFEILHRSTEHPRIESNSSPAPGLCFPGMIFRVAAVILVVFSTARAQSSPGSDPNYVALRNLTLGGEAISVTNFDLKRDAGTFRLNSGTVCFETSPRRVLDRNS